jgi:hypothetical protein
MAMPTEIWGVLSNVVTVIGLPLAIAVFLFEQRKERENEEEEVYQQLSDSYQDFLKVALENADLRLLSGDTAPPLSDEQKERQLIMYIMLVALFERAYLLLFEDSMSPKQARRWNSWEDFILEWCRKPHFRSRLPQLLHGEDPGFVRYLEQLIAARPDI